MSGENQKTILLVEDEVVIAMVEKFTLEKFGYNVITANTGEEAVDTVEKTPNIDLILMDIELGAGMDGAEAAEIILQDRDIPVVFLSAHTELEIVVKTEKITSYGFVVKNSSNTVLQALIKMVFKLFEAKKKEKEKEPQREAALEALREERWRLQSIIESTRVGTWEWNVQTGEMVYNDIWAQIIGYTLDELAPISIKTWESYIHPDDLKHSDELLERHFAGELPYYDSDCRMKHKEGHWIWVHDRGRVITRTADGKPLMMFGTHIDITERKQVEVALKESEFKFKLFIDHAIEALYLHKISGEILDVNETAVNDSGYSRDELLQLTAFDIDPTLRNFENRAEIWEQLPPLNIKPSTRTISTKTAPSIPLRSK